MKPRRKNSGSRGFTLAEMLVVIAIISMLAGQIMPSLSTAREKGRQANCINNFRNFSQMIEMYSQDYGDFPTWLSTLHPSYTMKSKKIFLCLTDLNNGTKGHGHVEFPTAADVPPEQIPGYSMPYDAGFNWRNPEITACSYIYEFGPCKCEWFHASYGPLTQEFQQADMDRSGIVTWKEAKIWQMRYSEHRGKVPIVRCFWHYFNHKQKVLNLASGTFQVFQSGLKWEATSD